MEHIFGKNVITIPVNIDNKGNIKFNEGTSILTKVSGYVVDTDSSYYDYVPINNGVELQMKSALFSTYNLPISGGRRFTVEFTDKGQNKTSLSVQLNCKDLNVSLK